MMLRSVRGPLVAAATVGLLLASAPARAADTVIGADFDGAVPVASGSRLSGGAGFGARIGSQLHLPAVRLTGELAYGYQHLFADQAPADWTTHRILVGARLGVGELLVPFVFGHVGYGFRTTSDSSYGGSGFAFDGGIGLDLSIGPLAVGGHAGYAFIGAQPVTPQWILLGLDATIAF